MDKQIIAVIVSFELYVFYVLLPMIPAIVLYRMFPDTKVSATGVLSNLNFKTTGAFAAYVITVSLGYFLVQNTHQLIAQVSSPVWTLKTEVELLNLDNSQYINKDFLETLTVSIDPELHRVSGNTVLLKLPGTKKSWETTQLKFDIPKFGFTLIDIAAISENAEIDDYNLMIKRTDPIKIRANPQMLTRYSGDGNTTLAADNSSGPKLKK